VARGMPFGLWRLRHNTAKATVKTSESTLQAASFHS
jgi:hypothetical protein